MNPVFIIVGLAVIIGVVLFAKKGGCGGCGCHKEPDQSTDKKSS